MSGRLLQITLCLVAFVGCERTPVLQPRIERPKFAANLFDSSLVQRSDLIAVGTAESEVAIGTVFETSKPDRELVQLRKVVVRLDTVLKGDMALGEVTFYYYAAAGATVGRNINLITRARSIYFMSLDRGVLRATFDVFSSNLSIPLATVGAPAGVTVQEKIAHLVMSVVDDPPIDSDSVESYLNTAIHVTHLLVGKDESRVLVRDLLRHPSAKVRDVARKLLEVNFGAVDQKALVR